MASERWSDMNVTLKLYATLKDYLPPDAQDHATQLDTSPGTTPNQLIDRYNVPRPMAHLVVLNGVYLHPSERDKPVLKEGDTLAIWPPVAGG